MVIKCGHPDRSYSRSSGIAPSRTLPQQCQGSLTDYLFEYVAATAKAPQSPRRFRGNPGVFLGTGEISSIEARYRAGLGRRAWEVGTLKYGDAGFCAVR